MKQTFFESEANRFVNREFNFENTQVLSRKVNYEKREIRVVLVGDEVPETSIALAKDKMKDYKLEETSLVVLQGMNNEGVDVSSIRAMVMEDFYKNSEQRLLEQQQRISSLETTLQAYQENDRLAQQLIPELKVLYPGAKTLSIARSLEMQVDSMRTDTATLAWITFDRVLKAGEKERLSQWLQARLGASHLRLMVEREQ